MNPQCGEMTGLEGRYRLNPGFRKGGEPVDRRDARQVQAGLQAGWRAGAEDQGQLEPGQALPNLRGKGPSLNRGAH